MHCITVSVVNCRAWDAIKKYSLVIYAVGTYLGVNPRDDSFGYAICDLVKCKSADIKDCGVSVSACIHSRNSIQHPSSHRKFPS